MSPTVILNHSIHDPLLTPQGVLQCKELRQSLVELPLIRDVTGPGDVVIIASAMRRTLQTALLSLDFLHEKGVSIEASALWQENSPKPCDTGSPVAELRPQFPTVDFGRLDPVFPDKTSPAGKLYSYTRSDTLRRARRCVEELRARPEKVVVAVSHSGFLRLGITGQFFMNADFRIYDFDDSSGDLRPWSGMEAGGLGKSFTRRVELGEGLPDE